MTTSILISSHDRLPLLRRTLWAIAARPPAGEFEVVVADDGSTDDVLGELKLYSAAFWWTFVRVDTREFARKTGVEKFFNNPALTNNVAFRFARGDAVVLQGNEVLPWADAYDRLAADAAALPARESVAFSTTYDVQPAVLDGLDPYGANLTPRMVRTCERWVLASPEFHADVTNYLCRIARPLWEAVGGFNEEYVGGLGKEDSDFVRRCRALPGWADATHMARSRAVSLHQFHGGRTRFYLPDPAVITQDRWAEGERRSQAVWDRWDGTAKNPQPWPPGAYGVAEVLTNRPGGVA